MLDAYAEPLAERVDRSLQAGVVERDQLAALLADEVMVVMAAGLGALESGLAVADLDALDEAVLDEQLEDAVDAGAAGGLALVAERVLDLDRAQSARLGRQQCDHALTGAPSAKTRACERLMDELGPGRLGAHEAKVTHRTSRD